MTLFALSTWVLPVLVAVTLHEAAHAFVAYLLGDSTAKRLGRVTLNPIKHIDLFGTILIPALLIVARSPILFGYAKPVPVNYRALAHPRRDMALVAAAGPSMNLVLALGAGLTFHLVGMLPAAWVPWFVANLKNMLIINVLLAIFNMIPIPPLDGGRIVTSLLPIPLATTFARLERFGLVILIGLIFLLPMLGRYTSYNLDFVLGSVHWLSRQAIQIILLITGHG